MENKGEIVVYRPDEIISLEVRVENDNVWLNRRQLSSLFGRDHCCPVKVPDDYYKV